MSDTAAGIKGLFADVDSPGDLYKRMVGFNTCVNPIFASSCRVLAPHIGDEELRRGAQGSVAAQNATSFGAGGVGLGRSLVTRRALSGLAPSIAPAKRNTGVTVLGHGPEYKILADKIGARRFDVPDPVWNRTAMSRPSTACGWFG